MSKHKKTLGERIRELRNKRDISLREFARDIVVSPAFLSDIEKNRRNPSDKTLKKVSAKLGVSVEELKEYDRRVPVEQLQQRAEREPAYGFALRQIADDGVSAEELLKFLKNRSKAGD